MTAVDLMGDAILQRSARSARARPLSLPLELRRCRRVVAATVHVPGFLLAAAGLVQRLGAAGVPIDLLVASATDDQADQAAATALGLLEVPVLARHRLALPAPIGLDRTGDLIAAMSELVGFAPEPGVCCLAPDVDGGTSSGAVVGATASRIAEIYRLRVVRFTATPDVGSAVVKLGPDEWQRKCDALAACATDVAALPGRSEFFGL